MDDEQTAAIIMAQTLTKIAEVGDSLKEGEFKEILKDLSHLMLASMVEEKPAGELHIFNGGEPIQ